MKKLLTNTLRILSVFGLDPVRAIRNFVGLPFYFKTFFELKKQLRNVDTIFRFGSFHPCLNDANAKGGTASGHYFHQDLLVATRIFEKNPAKHVDVGSRVDGFVAHVATYRQIEVIDIRPLKGISEKIVFIQADLMNEPPENMKGYCDSLSCLHALEHFGLGRYGDPVAWDGHIEGLRNLTKLLAPNGTLYLSVPMGPQRIEFNAHRVFCLEYLLQLIEEWYEVVSFAYVDDRGDLYQKVKLEKQSIEDNFGCNYGCAIFELEKRAYKRAIRV